MSLDFDRFAKTAAKWLGSAWASMIAAASVVLWMVSGPFFGWSDTWQLIANTATTVITFLMVFIIQNTQNRDTAETKAMLREMVEDLPQVDQRRAADRASEEC